MSTPSLNAVVTQKVDVSPELIILRVAPQGWTLKEFIPGQFTILGLPGSSPRIPWADEEEKKPDPEKLIKRPYSVASSSLAKEYIEFYIALVRSGIMTPRLFNLRVGSKLWLSEDFRGIFTLSQVPADSNIIMIATGTGLSPYMSMIRTLVTSGISRRMTILHGARHSWDLGYSSELFTLQKICPNFSYIPVISLPDEEPVPWKGETGFLHELWQKRAVEKLWGFTPAPANTHIFLCGNPLMIEGMLKVILAEEFIEHTPKTPGQIHTEKFI